MHSIALVEQKIVSQVLEYWRTCGLVDECVYLLLGCDPELPLPERLDALKLADVHHYVQKRSGDPLLPFKVGEYVANSQLSPFQLMSSASRLCDGVVAVWPYVYLTSAAVDFDVQTTPHSTIISLETLAGTCLKSGFCAQALGSAVTVLRNYLIHTNRKDALSQDLTMMVPDEFGDRIQSLREIFQVNVIVADRFGLEIHKDAWFSQSEKADSELFAQILRELKKSDKKFKQHMELYTEVRNALADCLSQNRFSQELVAERLNINVRNLQRRLKSLGTNYQSLLDEVRHDVAVDMVISSELPLTEIAFNIGYAEPSAFYKAFKRWTHYTPGDYRHLYSLNGNAKDPLAMRSSRVEQMLQGKIAPL